MNIAAETYGRAVVLNIKGDLNEDALSGLQETIDHHLQRAEVVDVILNVAEALFIDSATLEYLLDLQDTLSETFGSIKFVNCDENVGKILEVTRLNNEFSVYDELAQAVKESQS